MGLGNTFFQLQSGGLSQAPPSFLGLPARPTLSDKEILNVHQSPGLPPQAKENSIVAFRVLLSSKSDGGKTAQLVSPSPNQTTPEQPTLSNNHAAL
jgi:hypothetical protein